MRVPATARCGSPPSPRAHPVRARGGSVSGGGSRPRRARRAGPRFRFGGSVRRFGSVGGGRLPLGRSSVGITRSGPSSGRRPSSPRHARDAMPRRPSRAPAAGASNHAAELAELRRRALGGDLDDASALRLFLSHAGSPAALPAMGDDGHPCPPNCKGGARRCDCVCGLVPPVGAWRRSGLWQKDLDALVRRAVGDDPRTLARRPRTKPAGLKNLGSTCYVNAALQCLFALPSFRASVFAMKPERDEENEADAGEEDEDPPRAKGGEGRRGLPRDESGGTRVAADDDSDGVGGVGGSKTTTKTPTTKTPTPRPASREGPVASLRRLFASLLSGDRAVADPTRFADSLALESGTQQDGAEFLKLLLAYLERRDLAAAAATREKKKKSRPGRSRLGTGRGRLGRRARRGGSSPGGSGSFRGVRRLALRRVAGVRHDVRSVRRVERGEQTRRRFPRDRTQRVERSLRPPAREFRGRRGRRGRRRRGRRERRPRRGGRCGEKNR